MNSSPVSPDDPRLTTYALGEMDAAEHTAFAGLLAEDAAARQSVEEIRACAGLLGAALETEPLPAAPCAEPVRAPAAIIPGRDVAKLDGGPLRRAGRRLGEWLHFPQMYFVTAGLAAACFAVYYSVEESRPPAAPAVAAAAAHAPLATAARAGEAEPEGMVLLTEAWPEDRFVPTAENSASSFPLQVSGEGYARVRAELRRGLRPAPGAVAVAEMVNAFPYAWPKPADGEDFSPVLEEASAPWAPAHRLVRIGLKGRAETGGLLARDARVRVLFNPARVQSWRLLGFGRPGLTAGVRGLSDGVDVAEGQAVTVLYEIVPENAVGPEAEPSLLLLSLDYTEASGAGRRTLARTLPAGRLGFAQASADFRFAATVAAFGLKLQGGPVPGPTDAELAQWAQDSTEGRSEREEFAELIPLAGAAQQ